MQRIEYSHFDKSTWGKGPWLTEPDKVQWLDPETSLPCLIVRNRLGAWCGYVGVSKSHVAFEKFYDDVDVDVHGGLTFASKCQSHDGDQETLACNTICHIVDEGEDDDVWWLGFDCAHWQDFMPSSPMNIHGSGVVYRTQQYVTSEVERLAKQLKGMTP